MRRFKYSIFLCLAPMWAIPGCTALKPYERIYVNDREMQMKLDAGQQFDSYVQGIREGAMPAGAAKGSGGCGCN